MDKFALVSALRDLKDILEEGRCFFFPKYFVKYSGIRINEDGLVSYVGKEGVKRYIGDNLEYVEIVKEKKREGVLGKLAAHLIAVPVPMDEKVLLYLKNKLFENPTPESIDELFKEIERSTDNYIKPKIRRIYYEQIKPRNS